MLWMLAALIVMNSAIDDDLKNDLELPVVELSQPREGASLPDGRLIILMSRDELNLATALIESEATCRKNLIECASEKSEVHGPSWLSFALGAAAFFAIGFAAGFAL